MKIKNLVASTEARTEVKGQVRKYIKVKGQTKIYWKVKGQAENYNLTVVVGGNTQTCGVTTAGKGLDRQTAFQFYNSR